MSKIKAPRVVARTATLKAVKRINPPPPNRDEFEELRGYYFFDPTLGREFSFCYGSGVKMRTTTRVLDIKFISSNILQFRTENTVYHLIKD